MRKKKSTNNNSDKAQKGRYYTDITPCISNWYENNFENLIYIVKQQQNSIRETIWVSKHTIRKLFKTIIELMKTVLITEENLKDLELYSSCGNNDKL